jgi:hypothetical protein
MTKNFKVSKLLIIGIFEKYVYIKFSKYFSTGLHDGLLSPRRTEKPGRTS